MNVKVEINVQEQEGPDVDKKFILESHWNEEDVFWLQTPDGKKWLVREADMRKAIVNVCNH